jgi:Divergent InlB B-repeat domain
LTISLTKDNNVAEWSNRVEGTNWVAKVSDGGHEEANPFNCPSIAGKEDGMSTNRLAGIIIACTVAIILVIVLALPPLLKTYTLSVSVTPPGAGSVSPAYGQYRPGTQVTLTASPGGMYIFVNWTGDVGTVAGINATTTTITMNGDCSIMANFAVRPPMGYS